MSDLLLDRSFRLKVLADVAAYQKELSKLPDITGKQAAAAALRMERELVKGAAASGRALEAAGKGGATKFTKQISEAKEQVALLAAGAARIDPALGAVVNTGSAAVGVLKGMASSMGAITAIAAVAAGAFLKASSDLDKAESKANEVAKNAIKAQLGIIDTNYYVNQAIETQEKISLEKRSGYWRDWARSALDAFDAIAGIIPGVTTATDFYRKKLNALDERQKQNIATLESARDRYIELAEAQQKLEENKKKGKPKEDELDPAQQAMYAENQKKYDEAFIARDKEIADRMKKKDELARRRAKFDADVAQAKQQMDDDDALAAEASRDAWLNAFGEINGAIGQMFGNSKASALATAGINIALGATKTIAELGFPAAIPALIGLAASGAAQIQQINKQSFSPTFHSGGILGPSSARGDGDVSFSGGTAQTGEGFVLNRATTARLGRRGVDALNRGGTPGGSVSASVFGHRVMDAWMVSSLSRWNSPTRAAITKLPVGVRPGHRER